VTLTREQLAEEYQKVADKAKAEGAQAKEADLLPKLEEARSDAKAGQFWRLAGPWIAFGEAILACVAVVYVFIQAFTLGTQH
jgi:hypothetical protein